MQDRKLPLVAKKPKQRRETPPQVPWETRLEDPRWGWVEASIWTKAMLAALDNGVKGGKWYSLIDKVYKPQTLKQAWLAVKKNRGASGIDKMSINKYETHVERYLQELHEDLKNKTYKAKDIRRTYIPKGDGKLRPLGIPVVQDRIAQAAVKMVLEPIFEREFTPTSYGFRPGIGAKDALREVDKLIEDGYIWIVDADIQSYFDTIPHDRLINKLERVISDQKIIDLLGKWLSQKIVDECKEWKPTEGSPQGAVISPLLANIYLHDLDVKMIQAGYRMIRYADDFVILTKSSEEANQALKLVQEWMNENRLKLHPEKTKVGNCLIPGQGFEFLGYRFEGGKKWIRQRSILKFRDAIRAKTSRVRSGSIQDICKDLNKTLKGWWNYFKHVNQWSLGTFDGFVRRRVRAILSVRHKRRKFGMDLNSHLTWPNAYFAQQGLFCMEQAQRLACACQSR